MNKLYSNITAISWLLLSLTVIAVFYYSSIFFLGNEESHNVLKQEILKNLLLRTLGFATLGIPSTAIILIIEIFSLKVTKKDIWHLLKKLNLIISILLIASLIGSTIFFLN